MKTSFQKCAKNTDNANVRDIRLLAYWFKKLGIVHLWRPPKMRQNWHRYLNFSQRVSQNFRTPSPINVGRHKEPFIKDVQHLRGGGGPEAVTLFGKKISSMKIVDRGGQKYCFFADVLYERPLRRWLLITFRHFWLNGKLTTFKLKALIITKDKSQFFRF